MSDGLFQEVYKLVRIIPKGKVMTYGQIADALGTKDARKIGWALHANTDPNTPCHRVVSKTGGLAKNFAFDGIKEHKKRLESEGVTFKSKYQVNLDKHLWQPKKLS